jgi:hypothetical protein
MKSSFIAFVALAVFVGLAVILYGADTKREPNPKLTLFLRDATVAAGGDTRAAIEVFNDTPDELVIADTVIFDLGQEASRKDTTTTFRLVFRVGNKEAVARLIEDPPPVPANGPIVNQLVKPGGRYLTTCYLPQATFSAGDTDVTVVLMQGPHVIASSDTKRIVVR